VVVVEEPDAVASCTLVTNEAVEPLALLGRSYPKLAFLSRADSRQRLRHESAHAGRDRGASLGLEGPCGGARPTAREKGRSILPVARCDDSVNPGLGPASGELFRWLKVDYAHQTRVITVSSGHAGCPSSQSCRHIGEASPVQIRYPYMEKGKLKFFDTSRGFGFIEPLDGSEDVFLHANNISGMTTGDDLREGQTLEYETEQTEKGLSALNASPADETSGAF
jgi:CspA family cold shock protein